MTQYRIIVTPDAADDMVELRNYIAEVLCAPNTALSYIRAVRKELASLPILSSPKIKKFRALTNISTSSIFAKQSQIGMNSPRISCRIVFREYGKPSIRLVRI